MTIYSTDLPLILVTLLCLITMPLWMMVQVILAILAAWASMHERDEGWVTEEKPDADDDEEESYA